eukprot:366546-Chlamydomonas_euryale.AAC.56
MASTEARLLWCAPHAFPRLAVRSRRTATRLPCRERFTLAATAPAAVVRTRRGRPGRGPHLDTAQLPTGTLRSQASLQPPPPRPRCHTFARVPSRLRNAGISTAASPRRHSAA